jgi:hypothetical protein
MSSTTPTTDTTTTTPTDTSTDFGNTSTFDLSKMSYDIEGNIIVPDAQPNTNYPQGDLRDPGNAPFDFGKENADQVLADHQADLDQDQAVAAESEQKDATTSETATPDVAVTVTPDSSASTLTTSTPTTNATQTSDENTVTDSTELQGYDGTLPDDSNDTTTPQSS